MNTLPVTCFVSYELHPTNMGGAGVLIHHAAEVLLAAGQEVVFLLDMPAEAFTRLVERDVKTFSHPERVRAYRVEDLCAGEGLRAADYASVFQWKSVQFARALGKMLERERVDYVEFFEYCGAGYYAFVERLYAREHGAGPVLGSRLHGSLEVLDRHGHGAVRDVDRMLVHAFERRALRLSEAVLTPSRTYYEEYYKGLYGLEEGRVVVSSPPKQAFPKVTGRPSAAGTFSIAFLGRMFHLKGVDQFVHACVMLMKRRPGLEFTVDLIGYDSDESPVAGSYTAYLKTLIPQRLRERFVFHGQLSHAEVVSRLNGALFAVFPNRVESFCYALHEVYDAGVPVVVNGLPAFRDFFEHEKNALVYDGTTQGLLAQMERMVEDGALRERLRRPYAVAEGALGGFYEQPRALRPVRGAERAVTPLVVVMGREGQAGPEREWPAVAALRRQSVRPARVLLLVPASPDGEETLWWLGRAWHARDVEGNAVEPSDALTTDALAVLWSDDDPDREWLGLCAGALSRRAEMAFAGTWASRGGVQDPLTVDVAPELYPFERGAQLARVLVRTEPEFPLVDLFDTSLGRLGHTGYVWAAVQRWGHGTLLPRAMVGTRGSVEEARPEELQALLMRHGEGFAERLGLLAGLLRGRVGAVDLPRAKPTVEEKVQMADELGGSLLAKMALRKLARRVRGAGAEG